MRVVLVGSAFERERLRGQLQTAGLDVVGEFNSLAAAQAAAPDADAIVLGHEMRSTSVDPDDFDEPAESLTSREVQVLELLAEGLSNKNIAERLGISDQTVKFHVASISGKLGAVNRTDAVRRAVRRGLITL
jgi:ATP/maltotriose-dependent transcriptional regulator MalT